MLYRVSLSSQEMIIKLVCRIENDEVLNLLRTELVKFIQNIKISFKLISFLIERHNTRSNIVPNDPENEIYVFGEKNYIYEEMMGFKFKVPVGGFFQIHPNLASMIYKKIEDLIHIDSNTILLDICAGTGTFGIILGQKAKKVYFIECNKEACGMIEQNMAINNKQEENRLIDKSKIFAEKIEDCMGLISAELSSKGERVVAIVDPPRAGLHPSVVKALRTFIGVDELLFISCDFNNARKNLMDLCCEESKSCKGPPFTPLSITPFDIFPFTVHFETMIHMKRLYE